MQEYKKIKGMLAGNLAAGAVLGALLAGLLAFTAIAPSADGFFQSAAQDGCSFWDAAPFFAASACLACLAAFAYGFFLPLGREAIKGAKDRLLSGWLVGCLPLAAIQLAYVLIVLLIGSVVGAIYFVYGLLKLKRAKALAGN